VNLRASWLSMLFRLPSTRMSRSHDRLPAAPEFRKE
jgi:hypothetical protein